MKKFFILILSISMFIFAGCYNSTNVEQKPPIEQKTPVAKESPPPVKEIAKPVVNHKKTNLGLTLEQFKDASRVGATSALVMDQDIYDDSTKYYFDFREQRKSLAEGFLNGEVSLNVRCNVINLADKINFKSNTIKFDDTEDIFQIEYSFDQSLNRQNTDYGSWLGRKKQIMRGTIDKSTGMIKEIAMLVKDKPTSLYDTDNNNNDHHLCMSYMTVGIWLSVFNPELTEPQRKEVLYDELELYHDIKFFEHMDSPSNVVVRGNFKYTLTLVDKNTIVLSVTHKDAPPPPKNIDFGMTLEQFKSAVINHSDFVKDVEFKKVEEKNNDDFYQGAFILAGEYQFEKSRPPVTDVKQEFECSVDKSSGLMSRIFVYRKGLKTNDPKLDTYEKIFDSSCNMLINIFNPELKEKTFNQDVLMKNLDSALFPVGNVRYLIRKYTNDHTSGNAELLFGVVPKDLGFPASAVSFWWWLTSF